MKEFAQRKLGRKTVERYAQLADYVLPHLGHTAVSKLDLYAFEKIYDDVATLPAKRGKPLSPKTIRNIASVFDSMFKRAVKRYKTLKESPVQGCDLPKLHRRNVETLEPEDIRRFAQQTLKEVEWLRPPGGPGRRDRRAARRDVSNHVGQPGLDWAHPADR